MVELVKDGGDTRLWVTELVVVTVLREGADWAGVREHVKMFTAPLNNLNGLLTFSSAIFGLPVVRYMPADGTALFATEGGTALRVALREGRFPAALHDEAAKHGLFASQQAALAVEARRPLSLPKLPITDLK